MKNEMDMKIKIGARIKFLRTELGLTQEQLANKLPNVKGKSSIGKLTKETTKNPLQERKIFCIITFQYMRCFA